jgi:2-dehydropantoate 2-reductase
MEVAPMFRVPLELGKLAGVETPVLDLAVALATQQAEAAGLYKPAA